jgi:GGDEF domain-containing protein
MISIRKYLDRRSDHVAASLLRTTHLLLEAIERHAVKPDAEDYERFRSDWRKILDGIREDSPAQEVLVLAGQAVKTLEEYNTRATKRMRGQCEDLQNMVAMLTKTMAAIASGSQGTILRLQEIEGGLQKASMLEDFHTAKIRMSECLGVLRSEIVRHRSESAKQVSEMSSVVQRLRTRPAFTPEELARVDPLTSLPERAAAETALAAAVKASRPVYAAVFSTDRLDLINARFGRAVGDDVLLFFCRHVAQGLTKGDRLFRWTGPAILAVLDRDEPLAAVREAMNRLFSKRLTTTVTVENRSVMLAVPAKWMVFAAQEVRSLPNLTKSIDAFVHGEPPQTNAAIGA